MMFKGREGHEKHNDTNIEEKADATLEKQDDSSKRMNTNMADVVIK